MTVVGVVGRIKTQKLDVTNAGEIYLPLAQAPETRPTILMRVAHDSPALLLDVRAAARAVDSRLTVNIVGAEVDAYDSVLAPPRFYLTILMLFALLGLVTAVVGLYALLAHAVARRTAEIGVRMALGADARGLRRLVVREAIGPVALGLLVGLAIAPAADRVLTHDLFHVTPGDPLTLALAVTMFLAVAAVAAYLPARRATRIDPIIALRAE
jgi:hypothetical protein